MRQLIKEDQPGSGLKGKFTVSVKCAWEQKFISGVDPTFVYYDILQTILSFGGSSAVFYLGKRSNLGKLDSKLQKLLKPGGTVELLTEITSAIESAIKDLKDKIEEQVSLLMDSRTEEVKQEPTDDSKTPEEQQAAREKAEKDRISESVSKAIDFFVQTVVKKYRVQTLGVVTSLTGLPSTPWHVTLGNPLRPIFSSGDMLCEEVNVNLGPQLSFNDLPSYIEVEFKLTSARNLGIDEIMEKLSCGGIRVLREEPSFWNTIGNGTFSTPESITTGTSSQTQDNKEEDASQNTTSTQSVDDQSKVGNENSTGTASSTGQVVNPDPNSLDPILGKTELPTSNDEEYTVKPGDSIWKIAKNKLGPNASKSEVDAKMKEIISKKKKKNPAEADGIVKSGQNSDPDFIRPGDKLII